MQSSTVGFLYTATHGELMQLKSPRGSNWATEQFGVLQEEVRSFRNLPEGTLD